MHARREDGGAKLQQMGTWQWHHCLEISYVCLCENMRSIIIGIFATRKYNKSSLINNYILHFLKYLYIRLYLFSLDKKLRI